MRVTAIIPARYASRRFPGKPLVRLAGKPMILHVIERVDRARAEGILDRALVATDDPRILRTVREAGFEACMTASRHPTGTDRLAEVAASLEDELICNIQGDEPLIEPSTIAALLEPLRADAAVPMATLRTRLDRPEDRFDPNRGKVVVDHEDRALTFTRLPIIEDVPEGRDYFNRARVEEEHRRRGLVVYSDIGVYAYRREFLIRFADLEQTPFERQERLEQLRALEHGYPIVAPGIEHRALEVDTPADVARVEAALAREGC